MADLGMFLMYSLKLDKLEHWAFKRCNKKMNQTLFELIFVFIPRMTPVLDPGSIVLAAVKDVRKR